jgi:hypothetical protein
MELAEIIADVADALVEIDRSSKPFRSFRAGVGPYGEPQLVKLIANSLNALSKYQGRVRTKRNPDLLIPNEWAIEFKIVRPFGDNGKEAENWSVNLLHPYPGNVSVVGDCYKLARYQGSERRAAVVIGYEHLPSRIDISPLIRSFEAIMANVCGMKLSGRVEIRRGTLIHPVHQSLRVFAWEVIDRIVEC